jgi:hypothetical protein
VHGQVVPLLAPFLSILTNVVRVAIGDPLENEYGFLQLDVRFYVQPCCALRRLPIPQMPAGVGNPNFDFVYLADNTATSDYSALQLKFQRRLVKGLQALASYSFSHSIDISSTDAAFAYLDPLGSVNNPDIDRGDSDFDSRHSFTGAVTYDLPVLGANDVLHKILGY